MQPTIYTPERIEFIREKYQQMPIKAVAELFNEEFGIKVSVKALYSAVKRYGIKCGRSGQFAKGDKAWNKGLKGYQAGGRSVETQFKKGVAKNPPKPIGATRICKKDGYIIEKVAQPNVWRMQHRIIWEKHHGPIPANHVVSFKDNNKLNTDISNLMLINRKHQAVMTRMGIRSVPAEFKHTAMMLASLKISGAKARKAVGGRK